MRVIDLVAVFVAVLSSSAFAEATAETVLIQNEQLRGVHTQVEQTRFAFIYDQPYRIGIYASDGTFNLEAARTHAWPVAQAYCQKEGFSRVVDFKINYPHSRRVIKDGEKAEAYYMVLQADQSFQLMKIELPEVTIYRDPLEVIGQLIKGELKLSERHARPAYEFFEIECLT